MHEDAGRRRISTYQWSAEQPRLVLNSDICMAMQMCFPTLHYLHKTKEWLTYDDYAVEMMYRVSNKRANFWMVFSFRGTSGSSQQTDDQAPAMANEESACRGTAYLHRHQHK